MPYTVRKTSSCPASKPWGLIKKDGGEVVSCHTSKAKANAAIAAIYASEGKTYTGGTMQVKRAPLTRVVVPFSVKAIADPSTHTFDGLAAVIGSKDLGNDIIEPGAFQSTLKSWKTGSDAVPLLNSHNQYDIFSAIGQMTDAKESTDGLETSWEVIAGDEGDRVMQRLMPSKITKRPIVGKMSIGYVPVKWDMEQPEGTTSYWDQIRHLYEVELKEVSLVLFPMAPGAAIDASSVKSFMLSAQATDAKSLDVITKSALRQLASRIGVLLAKGAAETEEDKAKKPKKPDTTMTPPESMAQNDDPDAPTPGTPEDEPADERIDVSAEPVLLDAEGKPIKKPKAKKDDSSESAPSVYMFSEALQQRLQKTLLKNRVSNIGHP